MEVIYLAFGTLPETMWPADQGTVGVAAHNVYRINFPQLTRGDELDLETRYGTYRYHVTGSAIVNPNNRSVLVPDSPGHHLTLTTCWPLRAGRSPRSDTSSSATSTSRAWSGAVRWRGEGEWT